MEPQRSSGHGPTEGVPAFHVDQGFEYWSGKTELLDWVNGLLDLRLTRLEQVGCWTFGLAGAALASNETNL